MCVCVWGGGGGGGYKHVCMCMCMSLLMKNPVLQGVHKLSGLLMSFSLRITVDSDSDSLFTKFYNKEVSQKQ